MKLFKKISWRLCARKIEREQADIELAIDKLGKEKSLDMIYEMTNELACLILQHNFDVGDFSEISLFLLTKPLNDRFAEEVNSKMIKANKKLAKYQDKLAKFKQLYLNRRNIRLDEYKNNSED